MKTSVSTRKSDPESSRTLFPFVARGHGEVRVHSERLVQNLFDVPRPVSADVGVDGVTDHGRQGLPLTPASRVQLPPLVGAQVDLGAEGWHIQHTIQQRAKVKATTWKSFTE